MHETFVRGTPEKATALWGLGAKLETRILCLDFANTTWNQTLSAGALTPWLTQRGRSHGPGWFLSISSISRKELL